LNQVTEPNNNSGQPSSSVRDPHESEPERDRESNIAAIAIVLIAGAIALFAWAWSNERGDSASGDSVAIGRPAPDFALPDLDGNEVALSDFRGQVVLINFWATWCPPCRAEMPEMEMVYRSNRDDGFEILGVDQREDIELVRSFIDERGFSWVFVLDEDFDVSREYAAYSIPRSILVDRDGTVAHIWTGALTRSALERQLRELNIGG
jgi:cytochrome c biogenesis protein CcmG, thiol:disulfide interchange protein DsbE